LRLVAMIDELIQRENRVFDLPTNIFKKNSCTPRG